MSGEYVVGRYRGRKTVIRPWGPTAQPAFPEAKPTAQWFSSLSGRQVAPKSSDQEMPPGPTATTASVCGTAAPP